MTTTGQTAEADEQDPLNAPDTLFNQLEGWTWAGCYGGYYLQADLLEKAGFEHGFFTRRWQGRGPDELAGYLSAGVSVHRPQQVHGGSVLDASQAFRAPWPQADGLVSDRGGQSLWVCSADCIPVLIADQHTGHAAACHVGWRGVVARILPEALSRLLSRGARKEDLLIALGPAVSGKNYQVEADVAQAVAQSLEAATDNPTVEQGKLLSALKARGVLADDIEQQRLRLDIRLAAIEQLLLAGLSINQINSCPLCTVAEASLFYSWRRDQVKTVQWSGIVSQAEECATTSC
ncbi:MAG: peptidoglycan editing factor PgeF [Prochlorococcus sp.]